MYSLADYGAMIADPRTAAYREALRRTVRPGDVVVDVGAGTGIFSLFACQFGASRVYAIEPSPLIEFARRCAKQNGFADRIVFFEDRSKNVSLPERADVLVSDLRGSTPLIGEHLSTIIDARERFLKRGGAQIPLRDHLYITPIEAPEFHRSLVAPWEGHGVDLSPCAEAMLNEEHRVDATVAGSHQALADAVRWATLDYAALTAPRVTATLEFRVEHAGTCHGWLAWYEAELAVAVAFRNAPKDPAGVYAQMFLPLAAPLRVEVGDTLELTRHATEVDRELMNGWTGQLRGSARGSFRQSSLCSMPIRHVPRAPLRSQNAAGSLPLDSWRQTR